MAGNDKAIGRGGCSQFTDSYDFAPIAGKAASASDLSMQIKDAGTASHT
jgi:hypothetical protein